MTLNHDTRRRRPARWLFVSALLLGLLALLGLAVVTWGLVALALAAVATVPVVFALLVLLTRG